MDQREDQEKPQSQGTEDRTPTREMWGPIIQVQNLDRMRIKRLEIVVEYLCSNSKVDRPYLIRALKEAGLHELVEPEVDDT